jgi:hypothetical protein
LVVDRGNYCLMKWLKQYWYYPVLVAMFGGCIYLAVTATTTRDRIAFIVGGVFVSFIFALTWIYRALTNRETASALTWDTINFHGGKHDCFLLRYSQATKRLTILMGLIILPMLALLDSASSTNHWKAVLIFVFYPLAMVGAAYSILKKPGLRLLPDGLLVRARLKSFKPEWETRELLIPWDDIESFGIYSRPLVQRIHTEYYSKSQYVPTVFIGVRMADGANIAESVQAGQSLTTMRRTAGWDILIPATTIEKDQSFSAFSFVGAPRIILQILQHYRESPDKRGQIGTRQELVYLDDRYGAALRANPQDHTKLPA